MSDPELFNPGNGPVTHRVEPYTAVTFWQLPLSQKASQPTAQSHPPEILDTM